MLAVSSDNPIVEDAFTWARKRALEWVQTDAAPGNLPSYWAGYPSRDMFYARDVCHQAAGAHLLGLDAENFAMFRHFARSATPARKWYPLWAFHFDGRIAALDYHHDEHFVREIPAVFDLTYRALEQYDWPSLWCCERTGPSGDATSPSPSSCTSYSCWARSSSCTRSSG